MLSIVVFVALFTFRYLRTVVGIVTFLLHKPKLVSLNPRYRAFDVSVIVPTTFRHPAELVECLHSISRCSPATIFLVTAMANVELVQSCMALNSLEFVIVLGVRRLNKRRQILRALVEVRTAITVLADDDVVWPNQYLSYLLAVFEDPKVGAGGTRQRVRREAVPDVWNFLGICYLERRVWNNIATNMIDGSISTLSGRTAAYRTTILKNEAFFASFQTDSWLGTPLNSDDDKFLTRYVYSHGWKIAIQSDPRAVIETSVETGTKYLHQCMRWARAHWRGNFTVMFCESYWRSSTHWWGFYYIYMSQFLTPAILVEGILFCSLAYAMQGRPADQVVFAFQIFALWIVFTKLVKLVPHFIRHPSDLRFFLVSIIFSYLHGLLNVRALFTLDHIQWGSLQLDESQRAGVGNSLFPLLRRRVTEPIDDPETSSVILLNPSTTHTYASSLSGTSSTSDGRGHCNDKTRYTHSP